MYPILRTKLGRLTHFSNHSETLGMFFLNLASKIVWKHSDSEVAMTTSAMVKVSPTRNDLPFNYRSRTTTFDLSFSKLSALTDLPEYLAFKIGAVNG